MQGYRLGFVVSNPVLLSAFALVKDNFDNGQFIATQAAGVTALDEGHSLLKYNQEKYQRRLSKVAAILNRNGFNAQTSPGSFYLYVQVPQTLHGVRFENAQQCTDHLIKQLGIITVPWEEAGPHLRLSMTFELKPEHFRTEEELLQEFQQRLSTGKVSK
jgi:LL-diaminopimelate aminotransferase